METFLKSRPYVLIEFLILCIAVPAYIIVTKSAPFMFSFLWGATLYGLLILWFVYKDHTKEMWNWGAVTWPHMRHILIRWVLASIAMTVFIYFYDPDRMLFLVQERPQLVIGLLFLYPVLSALPQEFIFCTFFFERYKRYFGEGWWMVLASAVVFAYAHMLYINPVAPTLSFFGGLIFAMTYLKTKSLALVTIEHGLYGNFLFVIGLGWYFYGGSVAGG